MIEGGPPGIGCLAVPVRDGSGAIAGALAFSGPRHRIVDADTVLGQLVPAARQIAPYVT